MNLLYPGKLSRPKYLLKNKQNHENYTGRCDSDLKSLSIKAKYGARMFSSEFPDNGWKVVCVDSLLKRI